MTAADRRAQIAESARRVFAANGYAATRTRDIAAEAGVNEAMIYRHFPSKEELFEASVIESIDAAMSSALHNANAIRRDLAGSAEDIDVGIRRYLSDLAHIAIELGPLLGATLYGPDSPVRTKLVERLDAMFVTAAEITQHGIPGLLHQDLDVRIGQEAVFGALLFASSMSNWTDRTIDLDHMIDLIAQAIYGGLISLPTDELIAEADVAPADS